MFTVYSANTDHTCLETCHLDKCSFCNIQRCPLQSVGNCSITDCLDGCQSPPNECTALALWILPMQYECTKYIVTSTKCIACGSVTPIHETLLCQVPYTLSCPVPICVTCVACLPKMQLLCVLLAIPGVPSTAMTQMRTRNGLL